MLEIKSQNFIKYMNTGTSQTDTSLIVKPEDKITWHYTTETMIKGQNFIKYMTNECEIVEQVIVKLSFVGRRLLISERWTDPRFKTLICGFWTLFQTDKLPLFGMGKWQNTQQMKQKQKQENKKLVHRSQQQRIRQAFKAEDTMPDDGMVTRIDEGEYDDLTDGKYEKNKKRENMERQSDHNEDQSEAHGGKNERTDRRKDKNPERTPAPREQVKGPEGQKKDEGLQRE